MTDIKNLHGSDGEPLNSKVVDLEEYRWRQAEKRQAEYIDQLRRPNRLPISVPCPYLTHTDHEGRAYGPWSHCMTCARECAFRGLKP